MFRQLFLIGRKAILAAASLLLIASAANAQQGYFLQLQSQGWSGGSSSGRSYFRPRYVAPRYEENSYGGRIYYSQPVVSPSFIPEVDHRVQIHLEVPASARVWFDDEKTAQTGSSRDFITPPLSTGTEYSYAIRAEWTENGHKVESARRIRIHAGDRVSLDMSKPTLAGKMPAVAE
jgi:uncharacterized protein (TIGR03000 family)